MPKNIRARVAWMGIAIAAALVASVQAQPPSPPPVPLIERLPAFPLQDFRELADDLRDLEQQQIRIEKVIHGKETQCLEAFGQASVCTCLAEAIPLRASFTLYVIVLSTGRDGLWYADLDKADRAIIDGIYTARDTCVSVRK